MENNRLRFRAFHMPTKKMFDIYALLNIEITENTFNDMCSSSTNPAKIEYCIIEQCTGLKDSNGKLIYEGDIVKILPREYEEGIVRWDDKVAKFIIYSIQRDLIYGFNDWCYDDLEVIGNIHDNEELLN